MPPEWDSHKLDSKLMFSALHARCCVRCSSHAVHVFKYTERQYAYVRLDRTEYLDWSAICFNCGVKI